MDLRKAFDSVNRDILRRILTLTRYLQSPSVRSGLYSCTESVLRCHDPNADYFLINTVREGCVLARKHFITYMDHVLGRMSEMLACGMSFPTIRITDLHFADDADIFAETRGVLAKALDSLSEEAEPLGLRVSRIKTQVQAFGDILDATVESIPV